MTFQQWLHSQQHRDDPVGDLARDAHADRDTPPGRTTYRAWDRYLRRRGPAMAPLTRNGTPGRERVGEGRCP